MLYEVITPPASAPAAVPAQAEASPDPASGDEASPAEPEPDLSALRGLTLNASVEIGSLKAMNVKASDIEIGVVAEGGVLEVSPVALNLYDGRYEGECSLDAIV